MFVKCLILHKNNYKVLNVVLTQQYFRKQGMQGVRQVLLYWFQKILTRSLATGINPPMIQKLFERNNMSPYICFFSQNICNQVNDCRLKPFPIIYQHLLQEEGKKTVHDCDMASAQLCKYKEKKTQANHDDVINSQRILRALNAKKYIRYYKRDVKNMFCHRREHLQLIKSCI